MTARQAAADVVSRVTGPVVAAYGRLCLGTGLLLHGAGGWLAPEGAGWRFLARCGGCVLGLFFAGRLLERAPYLIAAVPVVWAVAAWGVSDSYATPPPLPETPSGDVYAVGEPVVTRVERGSEGVTCTIHVQQREVSGA